MGLLDDAIREHLELKRRRGADPGEIAHQERAALEPVFPEEGDAIEANEAIEIEEQPASNDSDRQAPIEHRDPVEEEPFEVAEELAHDVEPEGAAPSEEPPASGQAEHLEALERAISDDAGGPAETSEPAGRSPRGEVASIGQETAELDMSAVLEEEEGADTVDRSSDAAVAGPPAFAAEAAPTSAERIEWELGASREDQPPPEIPGQESMSFE